MLLSWSPYWASAIAGRCGAALAGSMTEICKTGGNRAAVLGLTRRLQLLQAHKLLSQT